VARGHRIRLGADGPEAEAAVATLVDLVASGLGEEVDGP
jgi:phosphotransferase system HPr-like phosphotransfer protein